MIEAKYKLGLVEAKLFMKLASMVAEDDEDFKDYDFRIRDLLEELNIGKENYNHLDKTIDKFLSKVIYIQEPDGLLKTTILSSAKYYKNLGKISFHFDPRLKPYLLQLKENFTKYQLENILKLQSFYSIRIYELLKQYEFFEKRVLFVGDIKKILMIEKKYKLYADFKKYVIVKAQKDLKKFTDIFFEFEEIKIGRKVHAIKFSIFKKEEIENEKVMSKKLVSKRGINLAKKLYKEFKKYRNEQIENLIRSLTQKEEKKLSKFLKKDLYIEYPLMGKEEFLIGLGKLDSESVDFIDYARKKRVNVKRIFLKDSHIWIGEKIE